MPCYSAWNDYLDPGTPDYEVAKAAVTAKLHAVRHVIDDPNENVEQRIRFCARARLTVACGSNGKTLACTLVLFMPLACAKPRNAEDSDASESCEREQKVSTHRGPVKHWQGSSSNRCGAFSLEHCVCAAQRYRNGNVAA